MFIRTVDTELSIALVEPSFAQEYFEIVSKEQSYLSQWLAWPPHAKNAEFFDVFINKSLHDYANGRSLTCGIIYQNELVGNVSFNSINLSLKKIELGYWLSESKQGKGIMNRVVSYMLNLAFTDYDIEVVKICAATQNSASRAVAEKLGFTLEGILTNNENLNGKIVDHAVYSIHKNDWVTGSKA